MKNDKTTLMKNDLATLWNVMQDAIDISINTLLVGSLLGMLSSFFATIELFILVTLWMVVADMIVGVLAARHRREAITSVAMSRTISKMTVYIIAILSAHALEVVFIGGDDNYVTYMIAGTISLREFKSLLENVEAVTGVELVSILDKLRELFRK